MNNLKLTDIDQKHLIGKNPGIFREMNNLSYMFNLFLFLGLKRNSSHGSIESKIDENEYLSLFSDAKPKKNKENSGLRKF